MSGKTRRPDAIWSNEGSIWLCDPRTKKALTWIEKNVSGEAQWFAKRLVVEWRYVDAIVEGMVGDGLTVGKD